MKRIFSLLCLCVLMLTQTVYAMDHERYGLDWVDDKDSELLSAKRAVIFPMEGADDVDNLDNILLQAARLSLREITWSMAISSVNGRSSEELAAEVAGEADIFVVPQVIWHRIEEGRTEPHTEYIDCHERETVEYDGRTDVRYDYHQTKSVLVPAAHVIKYRAEIAYVVYNNRGVPIMGAMYMGNGNKSTSTSSWQELYTNSIHNFFSADIPAAIKRVRIQKSNQPTSVYQ